MDKPFKAAALEIRVRFYHRFLLRLANFVTISYPFFFSGFKISVLNAMGMKISKPCFVDEGFDCFSPGNISIAKNCSFGHYNRFWAFNKIYIGPYVQTAIGLTLVAGSHDAGSYEPLSSGMDIVIEGENWIGANVTILGGVTVGRGAIIGAGSVVNKSIPAYTIAAGVPAKVIAEREPSDQVISPFGYYTPVIRKTK